MALSSSSQSNPIEQAVILAGGKGTRLLPLTETTPKPMISFHGRPFLEYLLEMLAEQGIRRVLILLGYLADHVVAHFGNGAQFGLEIEYSITDVENDTGLRVMHARDRIDDEFLLMYCDNYWPLQLEQLTQMWRTQGTSAQVVVYSNEDGYTKDNLIVDENGILTAYDKSRTLSGLAGVDIGFLLLKKEVLSLLPAQKNFSLEAELYPKLIRDRNLTGFLTHHRYYSVGDHRRLLLTETFLKRRPTCIVERWHSDFVSLASDYDVILIEETAEDLPERAEMFCVEQIVAREAFPHRADLLSHLQRLFHLDLTRTAAVLESSQLREHALLHGMNLLSHETV